MALRPIDLARAHGLSTQAVRNYEEAGVLPPAARSAHGYRQYGERHAAALRAFLALVPGHGHQAATAIVRAATSGDLPEALRLVDAGHAVLAEDRRTLAAVRTALDHLPPADTDADEPAVRTGGPAAGTHIGPLAHRLGLRPATLRAWERAGLVTPRRDPRTGYRVYPPAQVRESLLAEQLRRGGHGLARTAEILDRLRAAGADPEAVRPTLAAWQDRLTARGRALLSGAAALHAYLEESARPSEPAEPAEPSASG
ncbi:MULTISPECIES: MerR family DNA-binding transcriptional regulator [Kitasatospora]|uniref:Putative MerR family transcriptional regulator n=1 Tax=Kitasatospora setae (strain ATCC 33774 / DSM 43861 / JCM 3304 / KCC A-0304 / NBRC 14216 / KM-6054) TaxID=452652 RepID=E4N7Z7_KITSK|nr:MULTISPECIES: MerR family DNA-binding transcriptional regulator [Kitasatospora]BAJ27328.1 putative MerR family transcriptional regulator [Kitasatospora setae KM-6054]